MTDREIKEMKRHFKLLGVQVIAHLASMDRLMLEPDSHKRGIAIAALCNEMEMANDVAMRFGLNLERRGTKLRPLKR